MVVWAKVIAGRKSRSQARILLNRIMSTKIRIKRLVSLTPESTLGYPRVEEAIANRSVPITIVYSFFADLICQENLICNSYLFAELSSKEN